MRVDFPVQRVDCPRDAQLVPSSRVMRRAAHRSGYVDRGVLAKAEWERQLREKIEQREREQHVAEVSQAKRDLERFSNERT